MIRIFCDICGKELDEFYSDSVQLDFNCYDVTGFKVVLQKKEYKKNEFQLCVDCANAVVLELEDLQQIAEMDRDEKRNVEIKFDKETSRMVMREGEPK